MTPPDAIEPWDDIPDPLPPGSVLDAPPPPPPAEPALTRPQHVRRLRIAGGVSALWLGAVALGLGFRPDIDEPATMIQLALWSATVPAGLLAALRTTAGGFPPGVLAARLALAALFLLFAGLALLPSGGPRVELTMATALPCAAKAILFAIPPGCLAAVVLRRGLLNAPALRGALVGAVCGLAGAVGVHLRCDAAGFSHVLIGHGLSIAAGALAGALLGARFGRA